MWALLLAALAPGATALVLNSEEKRLERAFDQGIVLVDHDLTPMELDFSNHSHQDLEHMGRERKLRFTGYGLKGLEHDPNKTLHGNPWFRFKHVNMTGTADHEHFDGLEATGDFQKDIMLAHNTVRNFAGLRLMKWNTELEELAKTRAHKLAHEGCYIKHSATTARWRKGNFFYIGENLYKVINMVPTGVDIVDAWYAEIDDYRYGRVGSDCAKASCANRTSPPCMLGHFTQVMWADSTQLGCARLECPNQVKRTFVAVCNYGEGGNLVGNLPFFPDVAKKLGVGQQDCALPAINASPRANDNMSQVDADYESPPKKGSAVRNSIAAVVAYAALFAASVAV